MNLRIFLIALILSLPFWIGVNLLEKDLSYIFFWQEVNNNPRIFTAQIAMNDYLKSLKPLRDKNVDDLEINTKSALSVFINNEGEEKILFEKDSNQKLPIASLTKLMTALIVLENYDLEKEITVSKEAILQEENFGQLTEGRTFTVKYLLYPLLMESSNDAAFSLANDYEGMNEEEFVRMMNSMAQELNLNNTYFVNSTGLDLDESESQSNYSTANDLVGLTKELLKKPLIWEILSTPKFSLYGPELINTNELLNEIPEIVGGKTGYTEKAGGCMILVTKAPKNMGYLINIVLGANGSNDRFNEIKKLNNWLETAYSW